MPLKKKPFAFRISESDYKILKRKAKRGNVTMTEFLERAITDKEIIVVDGVQELISELEAIGRNLNQLTTLEPYMGGKSQSLASREYRAAAKGQSWKFSLMNAIDTAMKMSGAKQDFIKNMERQGYSVRWEDSRKYITYT
jgi:hypothetical protein